MQLRTKCERRFSSGQGNLLDGRNGSRSLEELRRRTRSVHFEVDVLHGVVDLDVRLDRTSRNDRPTSSLDKLLQRSQWRAALLLGLLGTRRHDDVVQRADLKRANKTISGICCQA
jgi:hypothetical protein